jgi:hypothetical protein
MSADISELIEQIRVLTKDRDAVATTISTASMRRLLDRIASLEKALAEAREALEPFADVGSSEGCEDYPDNTKATLVIGRMTDYSLTLGDFRRAARLSKNSE